MARAYDKETRHAEAEDGTRIAWHVHRSPPTRPGGARTVLLTNGIFTTENFWRYLVEGLTPDFRVVHWDYRGHGDSETSRSGDYSPATQAADLRRVIEEVMRDDPRPPLHVAFSMGVAVLIELTRSHPELVPAMALIAGSPDGPFTHTLLSSPSVRGAVLGAMKRLKPSVPRIAGPLNAVLGSRVAFPLGRALGMLRKRARRDDVEQLLQGIGKMDPGAWWETLRGYLEANGTDALPRLQAPALIVAAANDVLMPMRQMDDFRAAMPRAEFIEVDDAGHAGLLEAGPEVLSAVHGFLQRVVVGRGDSE